MLKILLITTHGVIENTESTKDGDDLLSIQRDAFRHIDGDDVKLSPRDVIENAESTTCGDDSKITPRGAISHIESTSYGDDVEVTPHGAIENTEPKRKGMIYCQPNVMPSDISTMMM